MKNKAVFLDCTNCDVFWFDVDLFGAYQGKYRAFMIKRADQSDWMKDYFDFHVWAGTSREIYITNKDIINLVYETIQEDNNKQNSDT